jgi:hypothetical protein
MVNVVRTDMEFFISHREVGGNYLISHHGDHGDDGD